MLQIFSQKNITKNYTAYKMSNKSSTFAADIHMITYNLSFKQKTNNHETY